MAISAEGPDLNAQVSDRLGQSPYLLIVDLETKDVEAIPNLGHSSIGAGMQTVVMIISRESDVVLTGWCSPNALKYLSTHDVRVVSGMRGTVAQVLDEFQNTLKILRRDSDESADMAWKMDSKAVIHAVQTAFNQMKSLLPVMIGVVFLTGLFVAFISEDMLISVFSGYMWRDSFWGAVMGSVFGGNPVNSYIIGGQLLEQGVTLVPITAFICAWVTVGLIQLPAESAALGWKFAVARNLSCFGLSMAISFVVGVFLLFL